MSPRAKAWTRGIGLALLPLLPLSAHAALLGGRWAAVALPVGAIQAGGFAWLAGARVPGRVPLALAASLLFLLLTHGAARAGLMATTALSHAALYATLLALFAASLRPGRVPVATRIADALHGPLNAAETAYCRRVTMVWAGVFAGQIATSALLLCLAPASLWSLFVNVLDLPLVLLVFAAEHAWRRHRFPDAPRVRPADMAAAVARIGRPGLPR